jgi:DNA-binding NarL/FixJ family response regulator
MHLVGHAAPPLSPGDIRSANSASARSRPVDQLDSAALEQLVLICLEGLAHLADTDGQDRRAARLRDATKMLRDDGAGEAHTSLTTREWEVAARVAHGRSNRQIAQELVISERTVDSHVSHVLRKLELCSRAQIAAWVVQQQPRFALLK